MGAPGRGPVTDVSGTNSGWLARTDMPQRCAGRPVMSAYSLKDTLGVPPFAVRTALGVGT